MPETVERVDPAEFLYQLRLQVARDFGAIRGKMMNVFNGQEVLRPLEQVEVALQQLQEAMDGKVPSLAPAPEPTSWERQMSAAAKRHQYKLAYDKQYRQDHKPTIRAYKREWQRKNRRKAGS